MNEKIQALKENIQKVIIGKESTIDLLMTALLAKEAGTCGTCMMTGVAVGVYKDLYDAKEAFVKEKQTFVPNKNKTEVYKKYYNAYKNIYNSILNGDNLEA